MSGALPDRFFFAPGAGPCRGAWLALLALLALADRPAAAAGPRLTDDAWLVLERGGEQLGWARERLLEGPGRAVRVERWSVAGERRERLTAALDEEGRPTVSYLRADGGDPVEVVLQDGRLRWRHGRVVEQGPGPPAAAEAPAVAASLPVPTALLRTLRWRAPCPLLLEEYGVVGSGELRVQPAPGGGSVVTYRVGGLEEVLRLRSDGGLLELASPAAGVTARRSPSPPPPAVRRRLKGPFPSLPAPTLPGWEEPTPELRRLATALGSAPAVLRYTATRLASVADPAYRSADEVLRRGAADCTGRATLAATLLRLLGHEVRHVAGRRAPLGPGPWPGHQWLELRQPDGSWQPVDPDGSPVTPSTHHALLRFSPSPRSLLAAELLFLLEQSR